MGVLLLPLYCPLNTVAGQHPLYHGACPRPGFDLNREQRSPAVINGQQKIRRRDMLSAKVGLTLQAGFQRLPQGADLGGGERAC